jgi:hypothetical protein
MIRYSIFGIAFAIDWNADKTEWRWAGCATPDDWHFSPWYPSSMYPSKVQFVAWVVTSVDVHNEE